MRLTVPLSTIHSSNFDEVAMVLFRTQSQHNPVYREYIKNLGIDSGTVKSALKIPFLPIQFFKTNMVTSGQPAERVFCSSGTTGSVRSKHHVSDLSIYDESLVGCFEHYYGPLANMVLVALLPSPASAPDSSLVYMVDYLISQSASTHRTNGSLLSGFHWDDPVRFVESIHESVTQGRQTVAISLSYKWMELAQKPPTNLSGAILMETGGMKGRLTYTAGKSEVIREELHDIMREAFHVTAIHSEYGMTELLSQAYSRGDGRFFCPPSMRVMVRDMTDPFSYVEIGETGALNIIDLANQNSCSFIATDDLGKSRKDGSFEVLGRLDNRDLRGCNLMM